MKPPAKFLVLILCAVVIVSCSTQPEPIQFGKDQCHFCKMTLMDNKFGAELVTKKGKVYKFDDIKCMMAYYHSNNEPTDNFLHKVVVDFAQPGKLIDATAASYITSPEIRSPMDGQLAAFESRAAMDQLNKQWNGTSLSWADVISQFK